MSYRKWAFKRWRLETRERMPVYLKLQLKAIHMLRRVVIVIASLLFRKYRREIPLSLSQISRVLIIPNEPIGDLLLTSPVWHAIKKRAPAVRIGVLCSERNNELLAADPNVDVSYLFFGKSLLERARVIFRARRHNWDVILVQAGFFKPVRFALLSRFIAKRSVTSSMHDSREERYHNIYSYCFKRPCQPYPQPMVEQIEALAERTFSMELRPEERIPEFEPPQEIFDAVSARLHRVIAKSGARNVIQLHLEAKRIGYEWGIPNSLELAERIVQTMPDTLIVLTASPIFAERNAEALSRLPERVYYFPLGGVNEIAALSRSVSVVISPDTGVIHLAAAAGTSTVGLYLHKNEWMPYHSPSRIIIANRIGDIPLLPVRTIPVNEVLQATLQSFPSHHVQDHFSHLR